MTLDLLGQKTGFDSAARRLIPPASIAKLGGVPSRRLPLPAQRPLRPVAQASLQRTAPKKQNTGRSREQERVGTSKENGAAKPSAHSRWKAKRGASRPLDSLTKRQKERAAADPPQRLAKVIARAGVASRRKAEDLITSGVVRVNDRQVTLPQEMVRATIDQVVHAWALMHNVHHVLESLSSAITVNRKPLTQTVQKYYFALNKPKGFLCANSSTREPGQQRLVVDLFRTWIETVWRQRHPGAALLPPRLFTVGRLDVQTSGLLFVTNDGQWAQSVQHPSNNITKEYVVTLGGAPTAAQLQAVIAGTVVDGGFVQPKSVSFAAPNRKDKLRIVVGEGRNREVRVLMENAGLVVSGLKRVRVGGYRLPQDLSVGEFRELRPYVVRRVTDRSMEMNPQTNPVLRSEPSLKPTPLRAINK